MFLPPRASGLSMDLGSEDTRYARYLIEPVAIDVAAPEPSPQGESAGTRGERAAGDEGAAGDERAPDAPRRRAQRGTSKETRGGPVTASAAESAGVLDVLGRTSLDSRVSQLFDANAVEGADAADFMGRLYGKELGAASGFHGLGLRRAGRSGGGDAVGTVGLDGLATQGKGSDGDHDYGRGAEGRGPGHKARVPVLIGSNAEVRGSLSKEVIRRTIQRHLAEIRHCYEEGRRARPDLEGRVSVSFVITANGTVQAARVAESELAAPGVDACISQAVRRWSFPQPEGGGAVLVTYPFLLRAAD